VSFGSARSAWVFIGVAASDTITACCVGPGTAWTRKGLFVKKVVEEGESSRVIDANFGYPSYAHASQYAECLPIMVEIHGVEA